MFTTYNTSMAKADSQRTLRDYRYRHSIWPVTLKAVSIVFRVVTLPFIPLIALGRAVEAAAVKSIETTAHITGWSGLLTLLVLVKRRETQSISLLATVTLPLAASVIA